MDWPASTLWWRRPASVQLSCSGAGIPMIYLSFAGSAPCWETSNPASAAGTFHAFNFGKYATRYLLPGWLLLPLQSALRDVRHDREDRKCGLLLHALPRASLEGRGGLWVIKIRNSACHSGIKYVTPSHRHHGLVDIICELRRRTNEKAYRLHPAL